MNSWYIYLVIQIPEIKIVYKKNQFFELILISFNELCCISQKIVYFDIFFKFSNIKELRVPIDRYRHYTIMQPSDTIIIVLSFVTKYFITLDDISSDKLVSASDDLIFLSINLLFYGVCSPRIIS